VDSLASSSVEGIARATLLCVGVDVDVTSVVDPPPQPDSNAAIDAAKNILVFFIVSPLYE
jgi:hypothetical protein